MEGATFEILADAEDLLKDSKKRITLSEDPYRSNEIKREDIRLALKNLEQFEKIYVEMMTVRE